MYNAWRLCNGGKKMATNWGDDLDEELRQKEKVHVGFMINFKNMAYYLERIDEETQEWDDQYPKKELITIWKSAMVCIFVLFALSYEIFAFVMLPFIMFYVYIIMRLGRVWKRFNYPVMFYWLVTVVGLIVMFAVAYAGRSLLIK